ncbi:hypothetical protein [Cupriavidus sp. UME77]|uniref:hypothetical protein n=1 Tax=Cupriavidus sp. UME77 TaxID=1862321 RepID=UPI001601073D|nr:hypothetical protein [Cupriavidus sp. UME77]MBB1630556.1 hypothetical protein [Cupriavidus sp. UME77]
MVLKMANSARSLIVLAKREIGSIEFQKMPIICLIWIDQPDRESVYELTRHLLSIGAINFLTYGNDAEVLHDYIDDVLIEAGRVDVATTDHGNSSVDDVVHFFINCTYFDSTECSYLVVMDNVDPGRFFETRLMQEFLRIYPSGA